MAHSGASPVAIVLAGQGSTVDRAISHGSVVVGMSLLST